MGRCCEREVWGSVWVVGGGGGGVVVVNISCTFVLGGGRMFGCTPRGGGLVWGVGVVVGGAKKLNFGGGNFSGNIIGGELDVLGDWVWKLWIIKSYPLEFLVWNEG